MRFSFLCNRKLKFVFDRKGKTMEHYLMISDAAKEVQVESHVLRYWEEELHLPIRRNELGHRYYTEEDVERFKQIKSMKERGLQLKAIKMILKDGKIDVMMPEDEKAAIKKQEEEQGADMAIQIIGSKEMEAQNAETREEKARRLQWLLQQLIRETLQENNKELCQEIKESVVKELDYQFRAQEEREEEREKIREKREEDHFQRVDELLRQKSKSGKKDNVEVKKEPPKEQKERKKEATKSGEATAGKQKKLFRMFGNAK